MRILAINPGSTSTKIAVFDNLTPVFDTTIRHTVDELSGFAQIAEQFDFRKTMIMETLTQHNIPESSLTAVVGRGGLLRPIVGGTYLVDETMVADARNGVQGQHAANLGCIIAHSIAKALNISAYTVDPVCVDEFEPLARVSGHPLIARKTLAHTLNIHAVGRHVAQTLGCSYAASSFVVAHLGGGISICPLKNGRIIDVNDASSGGPFSPERTGTLPVMPLIELCFSGRYTEQEMKKMVMGKGGLMAYLGTANVPEIESRIDQGDSEAWHIYQAMAYQIAKEIGAMATVLSGKVQAIILTGGLANQTRLIQLISDRVRYIAEVVTYPGEFEMEALAEGVYRVLSGQEEALRYSQTPVAV